MNLARSLIFRAYDICYIYFNFRNDFSHIKTMLKGNSFPMPLIDRVIKYFLDYIFSDTGIKHKVNENKPTIEHQT